MSSARDEALSLAEDADHLQSRVVHGEWLHDRPNSSVARRAGQEAKHARELAAVHANLAVAEELREVRILLTAWLTQCTQVVI